MRGAWRIVRFNWPTYAAAVAGGTVLAFLSTVPGILGAFACAGLIATVWLTLASLVASHWIYDRSPLKDWRSLPNWLGAPAGRWLSVQTGFDATDGRMKVLLPGTALPSVDLYGLPGVGGASVRRARAENEAHAVGVGSALPKGEGVCDTIVAAFALHEIAAPEARADFFRALARALTPGGRLLVVEHLRDANNFLVFGPGFLHFLPGSEWRRCAASAGLSAENEFPVTPFVRVFLWRKP